jgi:tRNA(Ile)-lysidine synthase
MNPGFSPDQRCLIGVSGGRDSVVLLHRLVAAGFKDLIVCHLDHALRPESAEDARFVAELAQRHDLEAVIGRQDVAARAKRQHQSLEIAGREARLGLFAQVARNRDCPRVFLAHHADDQVETFLFHLFRGSAGPGLSGMRPLSTQVIAGVTLQISRPLLSMWRKEVDAYVARHHLAYREDASNTDIRHTRNRLRHEIIPAIERTLGREIRRPIWRAAEILRAEDELIASLISTQDFPTRLNTSELRAQPLALQRRLLHAWLKMHPVPDIGYEEIEAVRALLTSRTAKANLPAGWHARRRARELFLDPPTQPKASD